MHKAIADSIKNSARCKHNLELGDKIVKKGTKPGQFGVKVHENEKMPDRANARAAVKS
jgi:hypothetical protein